MLSSLNLFPKTNFLPTFPKYFLFPKIYFLLDFGALSFLPAAVFLIFQIVLHTSSEIVFGKIRSSTSSAVILDAIATVFYHLFVQSVFINVQCRQDGATRPQGYSAIPRLRRHCQGTIISYHHNEEKHHKNSKKEKDQAKNGDDSFAPGLELSLFFG